jgi:hypothetical protein
MPYKELALGGGAQGWAVEMDSWVASLVSSLREIKKKSSLFEGCELLTETPAS